MFVIVTTIVSKFGSARAPHESLEQFTTFFFIVIVVLYSAHAIMFVVRLHA